jgi:hypothetical protein
MNNGDREMTEELIEALWDASNAMCIALPHLPHEHTVGTPYTPYQMVYDAHERILEVLRKHDDAKPYGPEPGEGRSAFYARNNID